MRNIKIFDTTLRDGEQSPGCTMKIEDKIEIAKMLDEMGVYTIEAGFASSNEKDCTAIREIAKVVKNAEVVSLCRCNHADIDAAYDAVKEANKKKLHIFIATSDIHIKDKLHTTREEVIKRVKECVKHAKNYCEEIEFSLEDATRSDKDFACKVIDTAIESGATMINIPDTVGYTTPFEYIEFINYLKEHSRLSEVEISVHCHNDLGMATANSLAALYCGINQIECTINGIGERAGNTAMEEVVAAIKTRGDIYKCYTDIDTTKIKAISNKVVEATGSYIQHNKAIVGENAFKHEAGVHQAGVINNRQTYEIMNAEDYGVFTDNIVLGIHSGKAAIIDRMKKMGIDPKDFDINQIVIDIKSYFEEHDSITDEDFISIVSYNKTRRLVYIP